MLGSSRAFISLQRTTLSGKYHPLRSWWTPNFPLSVFSRELKREPNSSFSRFSPFFYLFAVWIWHLKTQLFTAKIIQNSFQPLVSRWLAPLCCVVDVPFAASCFFVCSDDTWLNPSNRDGETVLHTCASLFFKPNKLTKRVCTKTNDGTWWVRVQNARKWCFKKKVLFREWALLIYPWHTLAPGFPSVLI